MATKARIAVAVLVLVVGLVPPRATAQAPQTTGVPLPLGLAAAEGPVTVFVELDTLAAIDAPSRGATVAASADTDRTADEVVAAGRAVDPGLVEVYRLRNGLPGVAVTADLDAIEALAARPDVRAIRPVTATEVTNASAVQLTGVVEVWASLGLFGESIDIGVIDTGIDYTHANFGGAGTPAAYDAVDPTDATGVFPTAKVAGGVDLAGEHYDADAADPADRVPEPDDNPIDCDGHGTHVAGTAAGFGVNGDGSTFDGDYGTLDADALADMRIGPGTAPLATLHAIKIFGCPPADESPKTSLIAAGYDWALDPNGDLDFSDRLDVVNLSAGTGYSTSDDVEAVAGQRLVDAGTVVVVGAGNSGDLYDSVGYPPGSITVGATTSGSVPAEVAEVTAPADVAGPRPGQYSLDFAYEGFDRTRDVAALAQAGNADGCDPFSAADATAVAGRFAWLEWDEEDATRRCGSATRTDNALAAGADGVVLTSTLETFADDIAGTDTLPVFQLTASATAALRPALDAGTLAMRLAGDLKLSRTTDPSIVDQPASFTSRGTRTPVPKPDLSAPGVAILSSIVGTGTWGGFKDGTSTATPHVSGIAALLVEAHPDWAPEEVKAVLMNSSNHDVFAGANQTPPRYGPNRVGSGRVDGADALAGEVIVRDADHPGFVSVGLGVVEAPGDLTRTATVEVRNLGDGAAAYDVDFRTIVDTPGAAWSASPPTVAVPPGGSAEVTLTLTVDAEALRKVADPTMAMTFNGFTRQFVTEESGLLTLTPTGGVGAVVPLRLPVYAMPRPVADIGVPAVVEVSPATGTGVLPLSGRGLDQGAGAARYRSMVSVLQLAADSPPLPDCSATVIANCLLNETARGADLRYVGAGTTAPTAVAAGEPQSALVGFGFAMWGEFANLGVHTFPLLALDTTGDGLADFRVRAVRPVGTDLLEAHTSRVSDNALVDVQPVNGFDGTVDTNTFDTDVVVLPVSLTALGIDPTAGSAPIQFAVGTDGRNVAPGANLIDSVSGILTFDPLDPGLWVDGLSLVQPSQPATSLSVHLDPAALGATSGRLLVLHLHNGTGERATVVDVVQAGGGGGDGGGGPAPSNPAPSPPCQDVPAAHYVDVPAGNVHAASIDCVTHWGLALGVDREHFAPAATVRRGQLATFIARLLARTGDLPSDPVPDAFDDDDGSVHERAIDQLAALGILTGAADGRIHADGPINREQLASIVVRAFAVVQRAPLPNGPDAFRDDDGSIHEPAIDAAAAARFFTGAAEGLFHPSVGVRRDQMATVLARLLTRAAADGHLEGAPSTG